MSRFRDKAEARGNVCLALAENNSPHPAIAWTVGPGRLRSWPSVANLQFPHRILRMTSRQLASAAAPTVSCGPVNSKDRRLAQGRRLQSQTSIARMGGAFGAERWGEIFFHGSAEQSAGCRGKNPRRSRNLSRRSTSRHRKRRPRTNQAHLLSASSISCDERTFEICLRAQIDDFCSGYLPGRHPCIRIFPNSSGGWCECRIAFPRATGNGRFIQIQYQPKA